MSMLLKSVEVYTAKIAEFEEKLKNPNLSAYEKTLIHKNVYATKKSREKAMKKYETEQPLSIESLESSSVDTSDVSEKQSSNEKLLQRVMLKVVSLDEAYELALQKVKKIGQQRKEIRELLKSINQTF